MLGLGERFANIRSNFLVYANIDLSKSHDPVPEQMKNASDSLEQDAVIALIWTLFDREETLLRTRQLKLAINNKSDDYTAMHRLRTDITVGLFAEALGISMDKVEKRNETLGRGAK